MSDPTKSGQSRPGILGRSCLMMGAVLAGFALFCVAAFYFWLQDTFGN